MILPFLCDPYPQLRVERLNNFPMTSVGFQSTLYSPMPDAFILRTAHPLRDLLFHFQAVMISRPQLSSFTLSVYDKHRTVQDSLSVHSLPLEFHLWLRQLSVSFLYS
jgi:hypothetical protein